ncbi:DNA end-binding protein Ku [Desulfonatronum thiosulfatophilum]|uniref:Non-homologous end joining protein Ku n=1 Tax=Desulfonatronum thiosulfatophilum TaxID=617002 RepID=A0A1G6DK78_9BACT|nr:Ku protein [Desulfonatronum thiosulfatophilum]SDB45542.1 DNA end-binding protein Ku [Desulfonatronum thiosulfatophilum]
MTGTARSIWKGVIRFGGISVPVKLFSAVQDNRVHFRLLHEPDLTPVEQRMVDPRTGKTVPTEEIRRGLEVETGEIVMVTPEELEELVPDASRDIEVTRYVPRGRINSQWYDRPYYLGPDGGGEDYHALAAALAGEHREGIVHWTMRKKRYVGSLHGEDGRLKLVTLRFADEVVDAEAIPRPEGRAFEPLELRMAEQLINALAGDFNPAEYHDEYRQRVLELIQVKAAGNVFKFEKPKQRRPKIASLADTLEQSLSQVEKRKSA